jgi:gas vesicle protein GvpO
MADVTEQHETQDAERDEGGGTAADVLLKAVKIAAAGAAVGAAAAAAQALANRDGDHEDDEEEQDEQPQAEAEQEEPELDEREQEPDDEPEEEGEPEQSFEAEEREEHRQHVEPEPEPAPEPVEGAASSDVMTVAQQAREQLQDLLGRQVESVSSLERTHDGWVAQLEVVELSRIPESTDVLGSYELELDGDLNFRRYQQVRRYHRSQADNGGGA